MLKLYAMTYSLSRIFFCLDLDLLRIRIGTMELLTTRDAAEKLGVSVLRVQQLIWDGRLPAKKMGRDYFINKDDLKLVANRKPGRPPKPKASGTEGKVAVKRSQRDGKKV
jgi:excisionase family DNA binding protein